MDDAQERERQAVRLSGDASGHLATAMSGQTFQLMAYALDDDIGLQPLVPDAAENHEEPTLPPHPTPSEREQAPCLALNKRKRSTVSQLMSDSSEMPIFSSDDDPAAENYRDGHGRQKRQYTGSWDRQEPLQESHPRAASPASRTRRKLERQVDSGIFMGSDASLDSAFDVPLPAPPAWRLPGPQFTQVPRSSRPLSLSPAEAEARRRIQQCIDADSEAVDLSDLELDTISNANITLLSALAVAPCELRGVPFYPRSPWLKLFLYRNRLTRLPKEIFSLDRITVLSLRANRLTEIPPGILKLSNLQELNVSQNFLKQLPMELLELMYARASKLRSLQLFPNPFLEPAVLRPGPGPSESPREPADCFQQPLGFGNRWLGKHDRLMYTQGKYWARTPVQFSDTWGSIQSRFRLDQDQYLPTEDVSDEPKFPGARGLLNRSPQEPTKVPSLPELVLRSCLQNAHLKPEFWRNSHMAGSQKGTAYSRILEPLEDMQRQREGGSLRCTVCERNVVRPTAQWIEWWELWTCLPQPMAPESPSETQQEVDRHARPITRNPAEKLVPFLRQTCSWGCVNDRVRGLGCPETLPACKPDSHERSSMRRGAAPGGFS